MEGEERVTEQQTTATGTVGVDALLQLMLQQEEQMGHKEEQMEREHKQMEERLERLLKVVEQTSTTNGGSTAVIADRGLTGEARSTDPLRLSRLSEHDDIEAYLTTFERMMRAYEIRPEQWAFKLATQLMGKAQQAYAALPATDATDYETVKRAILRRYDISEETYRQRFRATKKAEGESYRELVARLQDLEQKWTSVCTTVEELRSLIVQEQLLNTLPTELRVWVAERKPKTAAEAGGLADDYIQA